MPRTSLSRAQHPARTDVEHGASERGARHARASRGGASSERAYARSASRGGAVRSSLARAFRGPLGRDSRDVDRGAPEPQSLLGQRAVGGAADAPFRRRGRRVRAGRGHAARRRCSRIDRGDCGRGRARRCRCARGPALAFSAASPHVPSEPARSLGQSAATSDATREHERRASTRGDDGRVPSRPCRSRSRSRSRSLARPASTRRTRAKTFSPANQIPDDPTRPHPTSLPPPSRRSPRAREVRGRHAHRRHGRGTSPRDRPARVPNRRRRPRASPPRPLPGRCAEGGARKGSLKSSRTPVGCHPGTEIGARNSVRRNFLI